MGKPVLHFGDAWFRGLPGVYDASRDGASAYARAMAFSFDEAALRAALKDKAKRLWRGVINPLAIPEPDLYEEVENRKMVAQSIAQYFERSAQGALLKVSGE